MAKGKRLRRQTYWADGLSALAEELTLSPLNGITGGTYNVAIDFTSSAVLSAEGGEGMVVARVVGSFVPHFVSALVDGNTLDRGGVLRLAFARITQAAAGATVFPDLFNSVDLGGEDIMWMRQHIIHPLADDAVPAASVAFPNDVRLTRYANQPDVYGPHQGATDERRDFDVTAKRRVDEQQRVQLLLQFRQWPGYGAPDPTSFDLEFTAWARMLVLRALNR